MSALPDYIPRIEALARRFHLDYHPVDFEIVPTAFMMEVAVYGLPVRMPHWSFGVRYMQELVRRSLGHSRIFEVMFPGDPCHAYLVNNNSLAENTLSSRASRRWRAATSSSMPQRRPTASRRP
jgi:stage V sporulation protein R